MHHLFTECLGNVSCEKVYFGSPDRRFASPDASRHSGVNFFQFKVGFNIYFFRTWMCSRLRDIFFGACQQDFIFLFQGKLILWHLSPSPPPPRAIDEKWKSPHPNPIPDLQHPTSAKCRMWSVLRWENKSNVESNVEAYTLIWIPFFWVKKRTLTE